MTDEAFTIVFAIPLFILGCYLLHYSPARLLKRLFGKDAGGENDKTFFALLVSIFLDITSIMLTVILLAISFHWLMRLFGFVDD